MTSCSTLNSGHDHHRHCDFLFALSHNCEGAPSRLQNLLPSTTVPQGKMISKCSFGNLILAVASLHMGFAEPQKVSAFIESDALGMSSLNFFSISPCNHQLRGLQTLAEIWAVESPVVSKEGNVFSISARHGMGDGVSNPLWRLYFSKGAQSVERVVATFSCHSSPVS